MPPGIPVATVAINGAKNAAILAIEILAVCNIDMQKKLHTYRNEQDMLVNEKALKLEKIGHEKYLKVME
jgi:5-(carboxyamino)imidazole ribonucleotide mutase